MLKKFSKTFSIKNNYTLYFNSILVGLAAGFVSLLFVKVLQYTDRWIKLLHEYNVGYPENFSFNYEGGNYLTLLLILLLPALGGLVAGIISYRFSKKASGTGTDEMINAFHNEGGQVDSRIPLLKSVSTVFTLATGGSGGKEGPVAQIGGGIGVWIANLFKAGERARRTLLLAGTAAGLGSVFRAPLGGALTAVEMVYREDIESDALIPCFISSVTSYLIFTGLMGNDDLLHVGYISEFRFNELPFYIILGIFCYAYAYLFLKGFKDAKAFIGRLNIHTIAKPAIGGLLVGAMALFFYEIAGTGNEYMQLVFDGLSPRLLGNSVLMIACTFLLIAFLKIVATTLTLGSGGSAGIFGPSLFVGAMLGAAVGTVAQYVLPSNDISIGSYMVVGMGAFYAGIASAPIAGIIMVCEMTGSYVLLPPLILVSIFTFIISKRINFYRSQVENRFKSPAHLWDMKIDVLKSITIKNYFTTFRVLAQIKNTISYHDLNKLAVDIYASDFVVTDEEGKYLGMISLRKHKHEVVEANAKKNYNDLIDSKVPSINTSQTLADALNVLMHFDVDKVAVSKEGKCLGYLRSRDLFNAYLQTVQK